MRSLPLVSLENTEHCADVLEMPSSCVCESGYDLEPFFDIISIEPGLALQFGTPQYVPPYDLFQKHGHIP